jgi:hypothetical protein
MTDAYRFIEAGEEHLRRRSPARSSLHPFLLEDPFVDLRVNWEAIAER